MSANLKVGDVCLTINTDHPACNEGVLVVITAVNHTSRDARGNVVPYLIKRVDGQSHVSTRCQQTGQQRWMKAMTAWCAGYKLQRVEDREQAQEAARVLEILHVQ